MSEDNAKSVMDEKTKTGLEILEASVLLGIAFDALLRSTPLGLNVFLWTAVFAAAIAAIVARRRADLRASGIEWFYAPLILFSAFFAWRDSNVLMLLNAVVILATLTLISLRGQNVRVRLAGLAQYGFGAASAAIDAGFAPFYLLFEDVKWKAIPRGRWTKLLLSVLRGLAIAVPILLVFGGLFMAADAVFAGIVEKTINVDPATLITHGFLIGLFSWTVAGFLRGAVIKSGVAAAAFSVKQAVVVPFTKTPDEKSSAHSPIEKVIHQSDEPASKAKDATENQKTGNQTTETPKKEHGFFSLGLMETSIVLGLMNLLFASFVAVQVRYFFGGAELVRQVTDLTYADYARRGFFELVWVALLVLPILLVVEWLLRKDNPLNAKVFRLLAGGQIALLFVIMWSALSRMFLYQNEYGLTELRVYTTAFMSWLAVIFLIFCVTVLIGKRERFAFAAYLSALFFVAALHVVNPDALIARVNIERLNEGKFFDARYAADLSADAIPVLIDKLPAMTEENRCAIQNRLLSRQNYEANKDWRSWNFSRSGAWQKVESQTETWNLSVCPKAYDSFHDGF